MNNFKDFLNRYLSLYNTNQEVKDFIVKLLSSKFKIKIEIEHIIIKNNILYINTKSILKMELFLNQKEILSLINTQYPDLKINKLI